MNRKGERCVLAPVRTVQRDGAQMVRTDGNMRLAGTSATCRRPCGPYDFIREA